MTDLVETFDHPDTGVGWCSQDAARWAVMQWHYSRSMPSARLARVGYWERGEFAGAVVFGRGALHNIGRPFGLPQSEIVELCRVALPDGHQHPVTRIIAAAIRLLRSHSPGLRLIVSYADINQGHRGGIYQAGNWIYLGRTTGRWIMLHGKPTHPRTLNSKYNTHAIDWLRRNVDPNAHYIDTAGKHKYVYPLDRSIRRRLAPLSLPYPRGGEVNGTADPTGNGSQVRSLDPALPIDIPDPHYPPTTNTRRLDRLGSDT